MSVTENLHIGDIAEEMSTIAIRGMYNAGGDVIRESTPVTPYKKGELRQKRRVVPVKDGAVIQWTARHAAVQNAGRRSGAKPFTNYTTPGTGKNFVQYGLKAVMPKLLRYLVR